MPPYVVNRARSLDVAWTWIFKTLPEKERYANSPMFRGWEEQLDSLTDTEDLADIHVVVRQITRVALESEEAFWQIATSLSAQRGPKLLSAAVRAVAGYKGDSFVAAILALVALVAWQNNAGDVLHQDFGPEKKRYPGWESIPYECARTAMEAGALEGARAMVEYAYSVVLDTKVITKATVSTLERYRILGCDINGRFRAAVADLATDLRESCRPLKDNFRAEVGALLWSAGMVPESQALFHNALGCWIPSDRLCRQLVTNSLSGLSIDVLQQHIWLKMRDRGGFNLRRHRVLFTKINLRYHYDEEEVYDGIGEVYATASVAWFAGTVTRRMLASLFSVCEFLNPKREKAANVVPISCRCDTLMFRLTEDLTEQADVEHFITAYAHVTGHVCDWRVCMTLDPVLLEDGGRTNVPAFYLRDAIRAKARSTKELLTMMVTSLEQLRVAALRYCIAVVPTRPNKHEAEAVELARSKESSVLQQMQGAHFRALAPFLPQTFRRVIYEYPYEIDFLFENRKEKLACVGRATQSFIQFYEELRSVAPEYAGSRRSLHPSTDEVLDCLRIVPRV